MAFKSTISRHLPNVNFPTRIDRYWLLCIITICAVGCENMHAAHRFEDSWDSSRDDIDAGGNHFLALLPANALEA